MPEFRSGQKRQVELGSGAKTARGIPLAVLQIQLKQAKLSEPGSILYIKCTYLFTTQDIFNFMN